MKNKFNVAILMLTVIVMPIALMSCKKTKMPKPANGQLDLRNFDFDKIGFIKLNGEWEFYWNQLLTPEDFKKNTPKLSSYFKIPKTWYRYKLNGKKLDSFGYATFRLVLNLGEKIDKNLAIIMPKVSSAYNLHINGEKIISKGLVAKTEKEAEPQILPLTVDFHTDSNKIEIIIQVSNFYEMMGGIKEGLFFGKKTQIDRLKKMSFGLDLSLTILFLFIAIYYFNLFILLKKKDFVMLYSGLFALNSACLIISVKVLYELFPFISCRFIQNFYYFNGVISIPFFCLIIYSFYHDKILKKIINATKISSLILSILIIFTPIVIYEQFLIYNCYSMFFFISYILYVLFKSLLEKKEGALPLLIALFIIFIATIIDFLFNSSYTLNDYLFKGSYIQSINLIPIAVLNFNFFLVFIITRRFSLAFTKVELMSKELQELNINLEKKVKGRTLELEQAKNKIEKASYEKSNFFINLVHETKTPLTLILNYFKYYKTHFGSKKGNSELGVIEKNLYKLKRDMINFLNYEKIASGEKAYNHDQIIFLNNYLDKNISLYKITANNKKILIDYKKSKENYYIKIDPSAMDEILHNIITNAVNYTNKNGLIKIRLSEADDRILLRIADNGIGMTDDQLKNIFNSLYQMSTKKQNIQGMGMGMSIVKGLLDQVDGNIEVTSKVNEGTTFLIYFNKYILNKTDMVVDDYTDTDFYREENYSSSINDVVFSPENYNHSQRTILLIEDNYEMLGYLQKELGAYYNIYCAVNGMDALNKLEIIPRPNVIISDIMMDHMNGYAFLQRIQAGSYYDIPLIFLTARISEADKIKGLSEGAIDYIYKPFLIEELKMKIENLIKYKLVNRKSFKKMFMNNLSRVLNNPDKFRFTYIEDKNMDNIYSDLSSLKNVLTKKEIEIINEVIKGKMNKEISSDLNISIATVKTHMNNIYKKLNIQNRVGLINKIQDILKQNKNHS